MSKKSLSALLDLILPLIITIPAFLILFRGAYFTMHDDQHIARLFLLDQGLRQGYLYPRWVGGLGFGFGYPLYNFYPPLIYYVSEFFHFLGFSFLWSIKLLIIVGFFLAAYGVYLLIKEIIGRWAAILSATVYTYFFYHSVLVYVRGALAEFFTLAVLPFVFLSLHYLSKKLNLKSAIFLAIFWAAMVLTHPLIAVPSVFFIVFSILFYCLTLKSDRLKFIKLTVFGLILGLSLSAFFWLPSLIEKKYTLVDAILTKELANYQDHFVYPQQFWYSPWGYGGSVKGMGDGLTFQLGKIPILLVFLSLLGWAYFLKVKKRSFPISYMLYATCLLLFSLFMTTSYSLFILKNISYLWYMQFPWRFLTFTTLFISVVSAFVIYYLKLMLEKCTFRNLTVLFFSIIISLLIILKYQQYFRPQRLLSTNDQERTSFQEIAWRVSSSSYEFVPKGVKTKKTELGTTTLAIEKKDLTKKPFKVISGKAKVTIAKDNFSDKIFNVQASTTTAFRLNTYNFPGWVAKLDGGKLEINDNNNFKLITVIVPKGKHQISFSFTDTPIRTLANYLSIVSLIVLVFILLPSTSLSRKKVKGLTGKGK